MSESKKTIKQSQTMNQKRNTLKKVVGASAVVALTPTSWTKPLVNGIVLPAHAQTSVNQPSTVSNISCTFDTDTLQVGSIITIEATIADVDSSFADIDWAIINGNNVIVVGEGQFVTTTYTVVAEDIGNFILELEVLDGASNIVRVILCDETVPPLTPPVTFTIDSASFSVFEIANGQTQFDSTSVSGSVSASDGSIPSGAEIELAITLNPSGDTVVLSGFVVNADGSLSYIFGDQQFPGTGNVSATGVFSFSDQSTFGTSTFTATDMDLTS